MTLTQHQHTPRRRKQSQADKDFEHQAKMLALMVEPAHPVETAFRHSHWDVRRRKVIDALRAAGSSDFLLNRFIECGSGCTVEYSPSLRKHRLRASYCHCRHCEPCMRAKGNTIASNVKHRMAQRPHGRYRFITLTLKHSDANLKDQIARLYRSFKKLRNSKLWTSTQHGGLFTLEVKFNPAGSIEKSSGQLRQHHTWHVHMHIISEGGFLPLSQLTGAWLQITGDSTSVDVRAIPDEKQVVHYVTKYISKGTNAQVWEDDQAAAEWICSIKGTRSASTFGTWRGISLTKPAVKVEDWQPVCSLLELLEATKRAEPWCQDLFLKLRPPGASDCARPPP